MNNFVDELEWVIANLDKPADKVRTRGVRDIIVAMWEQYRTKQVQDGMKRVPILNEATGKFKQTWVPNYIEQKPDRKFLWDTYNKLRIKKYEQFEANKDVLEEALLDEECYRIAHKFLCEALDKPDDTQNPGFETHGKSFAERLLQLCAEAHAPECEIPGIGPAEGGEEPGVPEAVQGPVPA